MAIGDDIKEVFEEVGCACQLVKSDGTEVPSFFDVEANPFHSTIFIRQNCYEAVFAYDLNIENGDIVRFDGLSTLVMTLKPEYFEGGHVVKNAYLILCNATTGVLSRRHSERVEYRASNTWPVVYEDVTGLQYASTADTSKELIDDYFHIEKENHHLYVPAHLDVKVGDRWQRFPNGTPFEIKTITDRKYEGLHFCSLNIDERE